MCATLALMQHPFHTMSLPQQHLIDNTSQLIAYKRRTICIANYFNHYPL